MSTTILTLLSVAFYLASCIIIGLRLFGKSAERRPSRTIALALGFAGIFIHATLLYQNIITIGSGLNLGFFNALSLTAGGIIFLLMVSSLSKPVENLGIVLLPLAVIPIILAELYPSSSQLNGTDVLGIKIHILVSMLAYSLFALASVQAILLAIQDHHLRHRHPGGFIRTLPPLQTMESLLFEMIGAGFILLSFALFSGFMYLDNMFAQHLVHKTILSITAWIVFATLLWGRFQRGWRGQTALIWTLSGFVVLMLAYFGSKAAIELILVGTIN
ncbi:MAG: cytochrome c biogenesis protein CcsA [Candidatus Polarisedimenticolaceae bacterium]|nr:cytochrome c biogenesis protein CcsA [Candidatus Polarisedimenticolaceae bacterium]